MTVRQGAMCSSIARAKELHTRRRLRLCVKTQIRGHYFSPLETMPGNGWRQRSNVAGRTGHGRDESLKMPCHGARWPRAEREELDLMTKKGLGQPFESVAGPR